MGVGEEGREASAAKKAEARLTVIQMYQGSEVHDEIKSVRLIAGKSDCKALFPTLS